MTWKKLQRLLACLLAVLLLSQVGAFLPTARAADGSSYTLHDGTAVIPAGTSAGDVNRILAAALVEGFGQMTAEDQAAIVNKGFEYYCEGKNGLLKNTDWGLVGGFQSKKEKTVFGKVYTTYYDHPALAANEDGNYKVRLVGMKQEVTLTKAEKHSSSIALKEGVSIALPYTDATTVDFDALRMAIFAQVVDSTTPELTVNDVTIKYYAKLATDKDRRWVPLEGETVEIFGQEVGYPAISAGDQQIQISFKGDDTYKASSDTTTVTFTERPGIEATTKPNPTFKLDFTAGGEAIYDNIKQQVFGAVVESTNPALTVDDVTIEYYATPTITIGGVGKNWAPLEGKTIEIAGQKVGYPAIGEGTQKVRITWGGSKNYAAWQWQGNVVVTGREAAPFRLKQDVTKVSIVYKAGQSINYEATAQALREALLESTGDVSIDEVTVQYNAGIDGIKNYQSLDFSGFGFKFGTGEQTIHFVWNGNANYKPLDLDDVKVEMTDSREISKVVLKPSISIVYNMDASVMEQNIFEYVIDWDASTLPEKGTLSADDFTIEYYATAKVVAGDFSGDMDSFKGWVPIEGKGATIGELQLLYPQMGAGEQKIRVTYKGNADYSPSDAAELPDGCYLTVKKANVSVKVHSTSIYADEVPGKDFVTTDPADKFDIFTIYTGVSSVFVQLPERFTDNAFIKAVDPVLEKVGLRTIKDIMDKGITVGELKQSLDKIVNGDEYAAVRNVLKLMGIDVTTLQQIINVFNKITLLDNVRIALRTPDQVGIYTVYAVTNNDNYNTGFGMGALVVKKHYSGVKLTWNQNFTNGKISAADVAKFDFGATLSYNGKQVEDQSSVHYLYSGFTSKWKPYSSTKAPTEPGRYVMTVVTLGGNYQAAPITRSFQITK